MCTVLMPPGVNPIAVNKYTFKIDVCLSGHRCTGNPLTLTLLIFHITDTLYPLPSVGTKTA